VSTDDFPGFKRTPDGPRAWTQDEVRDQFVAHVQGLVRYWGGHDGSNVDPDSPKDECLSGLAFSILATIDGSSIDVPGFTMTPSFAPEDPEYLRENGANWYTDDVDIAGALHDCFSRAQRNKT
jgi:hypothetical protein